MTSAIQFNHVSKKYNLDLSRPRSLQEIFVRRRLRAEDQAFWALRDVSFTIEPAERIALIGANGSGKSTILKLISRVIEPTQGSIKTNGRIAGLLELGTGFHPDLTGRENIFLNASILGIPRREINRQIDAIIDFADIGPFIDVQVRNYSSGMVVRLGFAVTTALQPEILLIDEVLAVGDQNFQRKCIDRLEELQANGVTLVLVSHSMDQVEKLCSRAIWLAQGVLRSDGDVEAVAGAYLDTTGSLTTQRYTPKVKVGDNTTNRWGTYQVEIIRVEFLDENGLPKPIFNTGEFFRVRMHYQARTEIVEPAFGVGIYLSDGLHLNGPNTVLDGYHIPAINGGGYVDYSVDRLPLGPGRYELTAVIYNRDSTLAHDHQHRLHTFEVKDRRLKAEEGIIHIAATWQHVPTNIPA